MENAAAKKVSRSTSDHRKKVVTLKTQAFLYIFDHLFEYTIETLSVLPTTLKAEVLMSLPPLDIVRLENTVFTADLDMETVWGILLTNLGYSTLTKLMFPTVKESYMNVIGGLVINAISQCEDVTLAYVAFMMLGSRKCFGIANWYEFLESNPAMKRYGLEVHKDILVPQRYCCILDESDKDVEEILVDIFLKGCNFYMLQVLIQEQFINSALWEDDTPDPDLVRAISEMTSKVKRMNYINSFAGSKYHDDRHCMIRAVSTLTKIILSNGAGDRELCFDGQTYDNTNTLMMSAIPSFVGDGAFTKLKAIYFSVTDPTLRKKEIHTFYHKAALLIRSQDALLEVHNDSLDMTLNCSEIRELLNAMIHCLMQSNSQGFKLVLRNLPINPLVLQLLLKTFLLVKNERKQEMYLENVSIDETSTSMFTQGTSIQELVMPEDSCCFKSLTLKDMKLMPSFIEWMFHSQNRLRFNTLKLEALTVDKDSDILAALENVSALNLEVTDTCVPHTNETSNGFLKILSNEMTKSVILTNCNIAKDGVLLDLTMALRKLRRQQGTLKLKLLDLSDNNLSCESDKHLRLFLTALFQVVSVSKMEIRLRGNNFTFDQLRLINKARKHCQGQAPSVAL